MPGAIIHRTTIRSGRPPTISRGGCCVISAMNEIDQPTTSDIGPGTGTAMPASPADRAAAHGQSTEAKAKEIAHDAKRAAGDVAEKAKATAREAGERISQEASAGAEKLKQRGSEILEQQKSRVGSEVRTYSEALRRAAEKLEAKSDTNLAEYASSAADQIDRLGQRIEERSVGELVDDVEEIARRRPEVFFGGMFVAGLASARFLKASRRRREAQRPPGQPAPAAYRSPEPRGKAPTDPLQGPPSVPVGYSTPPSAPAANPYTGGTL